MSSQKVLGHTGVPVAFLPSDKLQWRAHGVKTPRWPWVQWTHRYSAEQVWRSHNLRPSGKPNVRLFCALGKEMIHIQVHKVNLLSRCMLGLEQSCVVGLQLL